MAQVSLYIPDELEQLLRKRAEARKVSLSAYVTEVVRREVTPRQWPAAFVKTFGSWKGPCVEAPDPPPDDDVVIE